MTRKGAINPYSYRAFSNNPEQMFNYTMANLMDNMYSSFMDSSTDGTFKAVCLSGIDSEDNNGGSQTPTDGSGENYISIVVRPLAPFGDILPDPTKLTDPDEIRNVIDLHSSVFVARADFVDDNQGIQYGQILNCYFESGKISTSDFSGLRFSKPVKTELSNDYIGLSTKTSEDSQIDWSNAQILGSLQQQNQLNDNVIKKMANDLPSGVGIKGGVGIPQQSFTQDVQSQLDFWKGKKESREEPQYSMLNRYWTNVGWKQNQWTPSGVPWSAAFISFQLKPYSFKPAASHYSYTEQIINGKSPGWKAFSLTKGNCLINIGDVLIRPRAFGDPKSSKYYNTHGDVVYKIESGIAYLAGGNLSDTAKIAAKINIDSNGVSNKTGEYLVILKKVS